VIDEVFSSATGRSGALYVTSSKMTFQHDKTLTLSTHTKVGTLSTTWSVASEANIASNNNWSFGYNTNTLTTIKLSNSFSSQLKVQVQDEGLIGYLQKESAANTKDHHFLFGKRGPKMTIGLFVG